MDILAPPTDLIANFLARPSVRAMGAELVYEGPLPSSGREVGRLVRGDTSLNTYLYMYFDEIGDDIPLYVGRTVNAVGRFATHKRTAKWYPKAVQYALIRLTGIDEFEARAMAVFVEQRALFYLRPIANVQHGYIS